MISCINIPTFHWNELNDEYFPLSLDIKSSCVFSVITLYSRTHTTLYSQCVIFRDSCNVQSVLMLFLLSAHISHFIYMHVYAAYKKYSIYLISVFIKRDLSCMEGLIEKLNVHEYIATDGWEIRITFPTHSGGRGKWFVQ